jgi:hypothetical protein
MQLTRLARVVPALLVLVLAACAGEASPEQRTALLRELIRARTIAGDSLPIDGCGAARFLADVPAWRDSLDADERARVTPAEPCEAEPVARAGRWTITRWYRNVGGSYVIRGTAPGGDDEYRFDDGVIAGHERLPEGETSLGAAEAARVRVDTTARGAAVAMPAPSTPPESIARPAAPVRRATGATAASRRLDSVARDSTWRDSIGRAAIADETRRRDSMRRVVDERTRRQVDSMRRATSDPR